MLWYYHNIGIYVHGKIRFEPGGGETRSGTEKQCSHNFQSSHSAWWSADNYSIFPTVKQYFYTFRNKKRTDKGNQKCLKN